jgi:hypothetical protein
MVIVLDVVLDGVADLRNFACNGLVFQRKRKITEEWRRC